MGLPVGIYPAQKPSLLSFYPFLFKEHATFENVIHQPPKVTATLTSPVHADLYSSVGGAQDQVAQLVTYFKRSPGFVTGANRSYNIDTFGKIGRKLWPISKNEIDEQLTKEACERAQRAMAYAHDTCTGVVFLDKS